MKMLTYHNNPELKAEFVARMKAHLEADEIIQGKGFSNGRGCAVGCTYDEYDHSLGPKRLGFSETYEYWRDDIFENLPRSEAPAWALASLEAVPVGIDLETIMTKLAIARHERQLIVLKDNQAEYARECENAIQGVIEYLQQKLRGDGVKLLELAAYSAESAESAARSAWAAYSVAYSVAYSAAESAAYSAESAAAYSAAAYSAAYSARSAARSAWAAYSVAYSARSAAWSAEYQWERDTFLELVKDLK